MFMFKYTGEATGNISLYSFIENSSKTTTLLDSETSILAYSENTDEYAGHLLISNERINRTEESKNYSVIILVSSILLLVSFLLSLACEILSMFEYYKNKVKLLTMVLRIFILALSIVLLVTAPLYINSWASGLEEYFKLGFSFVVLPILSIINVVLFFVLNPKNSEKGN